MSATEPRSGAYPSSLTLRCSVDAWIMAVWALLAQGARICVGGGGEARGEGRHLMSDRAETGANTGRSRGCGRNDAYVVVQPRAGGWLLIDHGVVLGHDESALLRARGKQTVVYRTQTDSARTYKVSLGARGISWPFLMKLKVMDLLKISKHKKAFLCTSTALPNP